MSALEHAAGSPYSIVASEVLCRYRRFAIRRDRAAWPSGEEGDQTILESPDSVFVVPVSEAGLTVLVRQWRQAWGGTSWEVPAGTQEAGEEPLACARRELAEEAGLRAERWTALGVVRGSAVLTNRQSLFLAQRLSAVARSPEVYEQDMVVRELPFEEALREALGGGIAHAASIVALCRAAELIGRRPGRSL